PAIMVGVGKGAENGILIKDAQSLEHAYKANVILLDKTGTITLGKPSVTDVVWADQVKEQDRLSQLFYSIEAKSEHPIAQAIYTYYREQGVKPLEPEYFNSVTGMGVEAVFAGKKFFAGNAKLLKQEGIQINGKLTEAARKLQEDAKTAVYFADANQALGVFAVSDPIKSAA